MANSASDARGSEAEMREKLIKTGTVDVIVSVGPNFFYTVTPPCPLWFYDKAKPKTKRTGEVLFIDARHIFRQIDRAHRDITDQQIEFLANIVRLWRGQKTELNWGSPELMAKHGLDTGYVDVPGLCRPPAARRSKPKAGASIQGAMSARRRVLPTPRISANGWKCCKKSSSD